MTPEEEAQEAEVLREAAATLHALGERLPRSSEWLEAFGVIAEEVASSAEWDHLTPEHVRARVRAESD